MRSAQHFVKNDVVGDFKDSCSLKTFEDDRIGHDHRGGIDNSLCHLDDRGAKIEAVMDSETAEPVAPAFQAPWVPMLES